MAGLRTTYDKEEDRRPTFQPLRRSASRQVRQVVMRPLVSAVGDGYLAIRCGRT